jgi:hypothetical protein
MKAASVQGGTRNPGDSVGSRKDESIWRSKSKIRRFSGGLKGESSKEKSERNNLDDLNLIEAFPEPACMQPAGFQERLVG